MQPAPRTLFEKIWERHKVVERDESSGRRGGWYADPFGTAARRWYDQVSGWTDRVQGPGEAPDKTGLARMDDAAVAAARTLARMEGIIPALESAHALAEVTVRAPKMPRDSVVILNLSGRGDKDMEILARYV